ncbi:LysM peptidoglycan-binding domain-containing protein [Acetanaerobacterium elongatum]|uniref:DNA circularisation protein N-terminus n=1 Tax=Acetanaerobacterium elongatum TaxID=258515 RepID=A0A1H0EL11_9FIRM|nr:LysM peptidoglycan-binding domain-containing protein [Acetanaerobacterium elongatum]SDN83098.1 DNA circularisation protein N-terminus [Acetanaerobacterium elongatum]
MEKLRYKEYTFPTNPRRLEVINERRTARVPLPFEGELVADMGARARMVVIDGEFFGANAMQQYLKLEQVYNQGGSGQLYLPGEPPFMAHFSFFKTVGLPGRDGYGYTARFIEDTLQDGSGTPERQFTCIVQENETLFAIAARFHTTAERLLADNPAIVSPNGLTAGQVIRVSVQ